MGSNLCTKNWETSEPFWALLQTSGMLKCEGVMNFDLVGQNLTMSGLIIIAIIGKKNWSEVWLRGFITHEPPLSLVWHHYINEILP